MGRPRLECQAGLMDMRQTTQATTAVQRSEKSARAVTVPWSRSSVCAGLCCAALLWGYGTGAVAEQPAERRPATEANVAAPEGLRDILLVSDEWHNLTRKDGTGLYFDLVSAVYARRGIQVHYRLYPYARAVQAVQDKKADGWVASFMHEKNFPLYPKWHFDKNEQTVIYRKDRADVPFAGTASLRNQRVAWLRDFGLDRYIQEPMRITEVDSIGSAFEMLSRQRIDYFVGAKSDISDFIARSKPNMSDYEMKFAMHLGLYVAFAPTERGQKLREIWDAEMEQFHRTDAIKAIYRKYGYAYPFP
jgi:polar amino acid transport system substrate-binding protein